ncbi:MAG: PilZ domain-containing protein [Nitrospinae bacterium]|nr:PilZ domain-containing protein [Nitrospinota bacterium]
MKNALLFTQDNDYPQKLSDSLNDEGFNLTIVKTTESFEEKLKAHGNSLVLLDSCSEMEKYLLQLKQGDPNKGNPVIVICDKIDIHCHQKAIIAGANYFIKKPIDVPRLVSLIINILKIKELSQGEYTEDEYKKVRTSLRVESNNRVFFERTDLNNFPFNYETIVNKETIYRTRVFPHEKFSELLEINSDFVATVNDGEASLWGYLLKHIKVLEEKIDRLSLEVEKSRNKEEEKTDSSSTGILHDISGGGFQFHSSTEFKVGDALNFKLILKEFPPESIIGIGMIYHAVPDKSLGKTINSLKYVAIHEADRERIVKYTLQKEQQRTFRLREQRECE